MYSRYESSGLTVRDFCANEVINEVKFYYWQKKLRESNLPIQSFVPIVVDSESPSSGLSCTTNMVNSY
ncbi:IS66 family insertion sequence element accessory protein TnpA [Bacteroides fragilis]|uniref:IS66 family insertion sequence element accessory protein TnpA n=1 Tax=Bacteroides fragilis TaxID=817 RepID=UPI00374E1A3F